MKNFILYIATAMVVFGTHTLNAQTVENVSFNKKSNQLKKLEKEKEKIIREEKNALKKTVIEIEKQLKAKEINSEKAQELKEEAAVRHALNIENRIAIIDNRIALLERNGINDSKLDSVEYVDVGLGSALKDGGRFLGIKFNKNDRKREFKYDRRTTSDLVLAVGFNNAIQDGVSLNDSDYRFAGSRFFEIGVAWRTRVFQNTNFLRFRYGLSFQINNLKPTGNRIFVDENGQTTLQEFEFDLDKSKIRNTNLVVPVHFEFGPSRKREGESYVRYSTHKKLKIGVGGYGGFNIGTRQKLKFVNNGERVKEKIRGDFNVNDLVYGLSGYIGWGSTGLYVKYDLNPIFNDDQPEQRNISLGLRFDLD
ncbi:hypothetical protein GTQ40_00590 [Flavobacteriaceae bacterium R38]|nr:hypothetical protein [Flavobacteriaceae bacterium R38]